MDLWFPTSKKVVNSALYKVGYRNVDFGSPNQQDKSYGYCEFFVVYNDTEELLRFMYDFTQRFSHVDC